MAIQAPKNILIAPLDWGAGHTTRCVPIINYLLQLGHNPIVAGNTAQLTFIKESYDAINTIHLDGYDITYSGLNRVAQVGLMGQIPGIMKKIRHEHQWLQGVVREWNIHGIISDNRYGLHHSSIPSVILTHQLYIKSGMGGAIDNIVQRMHYKYLDRFGATWVVDTQQQPSLAGELSHSRKMPERYKYVGLLSRFAGMKSDDVEGGPVLILLSGPEPQRSNLSRILWEQAVRYNGKIVFVEGSDAAIAPSDIPAHISYHKRLGNEALISALRAAGMVICRSGYSTIMDLVAVGKKAILIPTPGQTEQQYLGRYLHGQGVFYCSQQGGFDLSGAIHASSTFPYTPVPPEGVYDVYKKVVDEWLCSLTPGPSPKERGDGL